MPRTRKAKKGGDGGFLNTHKRASPPASPAVAFNPNPVQKYGDVLSPAAQFQKNTMDQNEQNNQTGGGALLALAGVSAPAAQKTVPSFRPNTSSPTNATSSSQKISQNSWNQAEQAKYDKLAKAGPLGNKVAAAGGGAKRKTSRNKLAKNGRRGTRRR